MGYHYRQAELKKRRKRQTKDREKARKKKIEVTKPKDVTADSVENGMNVMDKTIVYGEFLSDLDIQEQNLLPEKVLNVTHIKGEEKNLVTLIQFDGAKDPVYVCSKWANKHCPQLVIKYYESRIRWESKV